MKLAIISFTAAGKDLSILLIQCACSRFLYAFTTNKLADETVPSYGTDLNTWTGNAFQTMTALFLSVPAALLYVPLHPI